MEKRAISLVNISPLLSTDYIDVILSPKLCHLCLISSSEYAYVYTILSNGDSGPSLKLIWKSSFKVNCCRFSEDGKQMFTILLSRTFQIYNVHSSVEFVAEEDPVLLSALLEKLGVDVIDATEVKAVNFNRSQVTVLIEDKWLVSFSMQYPQPPSVKSIVEVSSCVAIESSKELIYCLTSGGNLSAYSVENGRETGLINLYSLLPYGSELNEVFTGMTVSANGSVIAVSDAGGKVYIANIQDVFSVSNLQEERSDCGASIISASSGASYTSIRTVSSFLRIQPAGSVGDSASIYMLELTEKDKGHSYKSMWDSYLDSLKQCKQTETGNDRKGSKFWSSKRETGNSQLTCISDPPDALTVQSLQVTAAGLAVWYTKTGSRLGGLYRLFEIPSGTCIAEQAIPDDTRVVAGGFLGLMDAFISPSSIWLFLGNLSRDTLVNKLLHCIETEAIGQLLQGGDWGDLVIPLPTLADGLKQHHLDVARLALGLHSQAFKTSIVRNPNENDTEWQIRIHNISSNMDRLFEIVYNALLENTHKLAFSEQLILLYLDHANDLLQFLHESLNAEDVCQSPLLNEVIINKKKTIIKQIMYHVVELRGHLRKRARANFGNVSVYQPLGCLDDDLKKEWSKWQTMEDEDVIHQGIAANNFPLLQTFLIICRGWSSSSVLQGIRKEIFTWLEELLSNQEIEFSIQILTNLGSEPYEELRDICLKSVNKGLRDNLAIYLVERNLLSLEELEAWDMLKMIEEIVHDRPIPETKFSVMALSVENRHVMKCDIPEISRDGGKLSIKTVAKQPKEWKSNVLVELYFNTLETRLESLLEPEVTWKFLLYNNREDLLIKWIDIYYKKFQSTSEIFGDNDLCCENVAREMTCTTNNMAVEIQRLFSVWDITQHMIDSINNVNCMTKTKEALLDHLSKFGVITSSDQLNPCSVLKRFCRTKCLNGIRETLNQPSANMTFSAFEDTFLKFCIKHQLFNLMFICFQNSDFSSDRVKSLCCYSDIKEGTIWFRLWLILREMNERFTDESIVYQAVKEATHYLCRGNANLYLQEHPLILLATVIFGKKTLRDVVQSDDSSDFPIKSDTCKAALKELPFLELALSSQDYPSREQDVTVYQLLQDSSPFDVSKLFGWQSVHTMKDEEMPHFASEKLSSKYGHNVSLNYLYYLKQGRPCYAANLFIVDELQRNKKISRKMRKRVCNSAHGLALQNFSNQSIVCACVSFIEIMGSDSQIVRIHVAAANKILDYLKSSASERTDIEKLSWEKVDNLMHGLIVAKEQASEEILPLLETALYHRYLLLENSDNTIVRHLLYWDIAVKFAKHHHLKLPEQFLKHCARKNMWLEFVLFIQIHQYPVEQVLLLIREFESVHLQEHLSHALSHKMSVRHDSTEMRGRSKLKARDSRKILYSRVGVRKEETASDTSGESPNQAKDNVVYGSSSSSSEDSWFSEISISYELDSVNPDACKDVFFTLLNCHRSPDPPRALLAACQCFENPLLAIFATCYEPSSVLACFCAWLVTSLANHISVQLKSELSSALQIHSWSPRQVQTLLEETVGVRCVKTLSRGFKIFFPDNPLCIFTEFLVECAVKKKFKESITMVKMFKASCANLKINASIMDSEDLEGTFLNNGYWIGSVALSLTCITLANCFSSSYHELLFLNTLCEASFADDLPVNAPNFKLLAKIAECLSDSGVHADWVALCRDNTCAEYQAELQKCLDQLVVVGKYQQALDFSVLVGLPKDSVLIAQWSNELDKWKNEAECHPEEDFVDNLSKCHEAFVKANINRRTAIDFFKEHADKMSVHKQRYHILKFSLKWLREFKKYELASNGNISSVENEEDGIELEMWKCLLQSYMELEDSLFEGITITNTKLLCNTKMEVQAASGMSRFQNNIFLDDIQQIERLDLLIGKLLDQGDICTACRLQAMFTHHNQDLQLLLVCMSLAEGEITPYQLSLEHRVLLSEKKSKPGSGYKRRALHSVRLGSASSSGMATPGSSHSASNQSINLEISDINVRERHETLSVLEKLVENLQHGQKLGSRLVFCYRVSMNLDKPFQDILKLEEPLKLLNTTLAEECKNKWQVASDIMLAAQLSSEDVATLLCDEIVSAIRNYRRGEVNEFGGITLWGCELEVNFHRVLDLCDEPSKLGTKLLKEAIKLGAINPDSNKEVVEILIRAHDCYTAALNMEGIASVLHRVQILTSNLLQRQEWSLMVRLLTGIGRYTEMNYVFQILKDNEQFEYLLGRGHGDVKDLKSAILDYLKAHCPEDHETFLLVSLHYSMFSDVAELWEKEGHEKVQKLLTNTAPQRTTSILLSNTEDTKNALHNAMQCFTHAAEYYLQAEKLTKALSVSYQAELIALQTSLLNFVPAGHQVDSLLHLSSAEVTSIITHKLRFPQACIVARAYGLSVDWGEALYQHCIVEGDVTYLPDFMYNKPLTTSLVEDVARRFQHEPNRTQEMYQQMKKFVLGVPDIEVKYCVASQLGFRGIVENLVNSPDVPYLKDTVWRSGYSKKQPYL